MLRNYRIEEDYEEMELVEELPKCDNCLDDVDSYQKVFKDTNTGKIYCCEECLLEALKVEIVDSIGSHCGCCGEKMVANGQLVFSDSQDDYCKLECLMENTGIIWEVV
jgi:hypothetical protein